MAFFDGLPRFCSLQHGAQQMPFRVPPAKHPLPAKLERAKGGEVHARVNGCTSRRKRTWCIIGRCFPARSINSPAGAPVRSSRRLHAPRCCLPPRPTARNSRAQQRRPAILSRGYGKPRFWNRSPAQLPFPSESETTWTPGMSFACCFGATCGGSSVSCPRRSSNPTPPLRDCMTSSGTRHSGSSSSWPAQAEKRSGSLGRCRSRRWLFGDAVSH